MAENRTSADFADEPQGPDENLVAYLDGELEGDTLLQVERRLAADAATQEALTGLERSWDALEELGRAHVDETFTQTTMEMVALAAADDVSRAAQRRPRTRRKRILVGTALMGLAAALGYGAVALWVPDPDESLLRDLPVVENLDQYHQVGDIDFLERLQREGLFSQEDRGGP